MKHQFISLLIVNFIVVFFLGCDKSKNDVITSRTIHGVVFNNSTDCGLAGVEVFLQTFKDQRELVQQKGTISGSDGKFQFSDAEIHSDDKFTYALHIESKSGTSAKTPEHCGFNGTTMFFFKDEVDLEFKPRVTPKFLRCCFQLLPATIINSPDSISISTQQKTFHKNVPDFPYEAVQGPNGLHGGIVSCLWSNFPMGLWQIKIEKWKNGNYTVKNDSVYLNWKAAQTYTLEW